MIKIYKCKIFKLEEYDEWPKRPELSDLPDTWQTPYNLIDFTKELNKFKKGEKNLIDIYNTPIMIQNALNSIPKIEEKFKKLYYKENTSLSKFDWDNWDSYDTDVLLDAIEYELKKVKNEKSINHK